MFFQKLEIRTKRLFYAMCLFTHRTEKFINREKQSDRKAGSKC